MKKPCPNCGGIVSRKASIDPNVIVTTTPRVCVACGHQYTVPPPRWVGFVALLFSLALLVAIAYEGFLPQPDWPYRLTWRGRLTALFIAGLLTVLGGGVLRGDAGREPSAQVPNLDELRRRGKDFRARHPVARYLDILGGVVILILMLLWLMR